MIFACFQKSTSVGRASGSALTAILMLLSLKARRRFQSVAPPLAEALPVGCSFMAFCPPCRNDPSLGFRYIGVNQRDLKTVYDADCVDSSFSIVKPVIHPLKRRPFENPDRILEGDSMTRNIPPALRSEEHTSELQSLRHL